MNLLDYTLHRGNMPYFVLAGLELYYGLDNGDSYPPEDKVETLIEYAGAVLADQDNDPARRIWLELCEEVGLTDPYRLLILAMSMSAIEGTPWFTYSVDPPHITLAEGKEGIIQVDIAIFSYVLHSETWNRVPPVTLPGVDQEEKPPTTTYKLNP